MTLLGILAVCGLSLAGCASTGPVSVTLPADAPFTVAMVEIAEETNSFSPVPTTLRDFEAAGLLYGQDVIARGATKNTALGGFLQAIADHGDGKIAVRPILRAWTMSGGPVERGVYERLKKELLDGLAAAPRLDGVYLSLHGAMGVDGLRDPEGDLHRGVRDQPAPGLLPDGVRLGQDARRHRAREDQAGHGGAQNAPPQGRRHEHGLPRPHEQGLPRHGEGGEAAGRALGVGVPVHIWLDDEELGWSTVAVMDGNAELATRTADAIADAAWSIRSVTHPKSYSAEEAVAIAKKRWLARNTGAIVICDVADAVGAGAPGENTRIPRPVYPRDDVEGWR